MNPTRTSAIVFIILLGMGLFSFRNPEAKSLTEGSGTLDFTKILLVQRHAIKSSHVYTYHEEDNNAGGGLYIFDIESESLKKIVESENGLILDANLHYDGRTILFSWKKEMSGFFQLYTIDVDGMNLRQLTNHPSNNFNACWLPNDEIAFLSDRKPAFAYCWRTTTPILFKCNADGSKQTRLSANYLNDFTPSVMEDGRILYSRWEYVDRPAIPIQSLWAINPDGTKLAGVFGNRALSPATFMDARSIPDSDGEILCVLTAHNGHCHGAIGIINPRIGGNSQAAINNITPEINIGLVDEGDGNRIRGPYVNPFPLDNTCYLVSRDGTIELRTYDNTMITEMVAGLGSDSLGFYSPQPVRKRKKERLMSSTLPPGQDNSLEQEGEWAEIQMMDVYNGLPETIKRGSIKKLAIVQEMEKPLGISPDLRAFGFQFPVVSAGATYAPKKVWGFARVEEDGSARFKVPARQPIYFLPLDEKGMAVQRMRTFTHLMPGETQGCIGCHADRNYVVKVNSNRPMAMAHEAEQLEEPEWGVSGFNYTRQVQPVLDKYCISCHGRNDPAAGLELTGDKTDFFNISYENLVRRGTPAENFMMGGTSAAFNNKYTSWIPTYNGQEANILRIEPGEWGARASLLTTIIDSGCADENGKSRVDLSDNEKLNLYMWMDLNVPYYGGSNSNYQANRGCRQQIPPGFTEAFEDISARRCAACHSQEDNQSVFSYPNQFALRIDHPELNPILMAPLDPLAGGSGKCKEIVFKSAEDDDYLKLLHTFDQLAKDLELRPRLDMFSGKTEMGCQIPDNRTYLIGDYSNGKVSIYSDIFGNVWSYPMPGVYDCWMRPNGNVIAAGYNKVVEIDPDISLGHGGKLLWSYEQGSAGSDYKGKSEVHSCQLLPDGNVLIAEAGLPRLLEIDPRGELVKTVHLPSTDQGVHEQIRMVRSDREGNYWVSYLGDGIIYRVNAQGEVIRKIDLEKGETSPHLVYEALPLPNGNILVSGAGTGKVIELNSLGEIVWEIGQDELPGIRLEWIAGIQRLPNNNTIISNWGNGQSEVKALEVTPDKKIVWQLTNKSYKGISRIQVLPSGAYR
ncbi:MAG: hypothetical protein GY790_01565 [Bacteroidetes bacterium]|nr:hypothetical protein [Bacteroidota bacterium]